MWNECKENQAWRLHRKIENDIRLASEYPSRFSHNDLDHLRREYGTLLYDINLGYTNIWSIKSATRYALYGIRPVHEHGFGRNACGAYLWQYILTNPCTTQDQFKQLLEPMCLTNRTTQQENHKLRDVQNEQPFGVLWTQEYIYKAANVPTVHLPLPPSRKAWSQPLMLSTLKEVGII